MAGSGGGGFIRRHTMRAMDSSSTVMPNDLWSWMMAIFGLPGPPGMVVHDPADGDQPDDEKGDGPVQGDGDGGVALLKRARLRRGLRGGVGHRCLPSDRRGFGRA